MAREPHERPEIRSAPSDTSAVPDPRAGRADAAVRALEHQLYEASQRLREAVADHDALEAIADDAAEPGVAGRARAHQDLARARWSAALGARAALEAVYQELAGSPSPQHEADARVLGDHGIAPHPVGLQGRDPDTAAFLHAHAADRHTDQTQTQHRDRSTADYGLDR